MKKIKVGFVPGYSALDRAFILLAFSVLIGSPFQLNAAQAGTVVGWGDNFYGLLNFPSGLTNISAVSEGYEHAVALRQDGTVVCWGANSWGQLNIPPSATNGAAIAAGYDHTLLLKGDGTIVEWGDRFGISNLTPSLNDVAAIAAGYHFSMALRSNGNVMAWGSDINAPTNIPPGLSNVTAIAAGFSHALALKSDGTIVSWGANDVGQRNFPAGLSNVVLIAAKWGSSFALTANHVPVQLGSIAAYPLPAGQWDQVFQVGLGGDFAIALKSDRTIFGWGNTASGTLSFPSNLVNVITAGAESDVTLLILRGPAVRTQPVSQTLLAGKNATLAASVESSNPYAFQWFFNQVPLLNATNATLQFTNLHVSDSGYYFASVSNIYGSMTTSNARLSVLPLTISVGTSWSAETADTVTLTPSVQSMFQPLAYQWYFGGNAIAGATNSSLSLTNVQYSNQGSYVVCVSNQEGGTCSSPMTLTVYPKWTVSDATVVRTNGAATSIRFQIYLLGPRPEDLTVSYSTSDATAHAGIDYLSKSGSNTFLHGVTNMAVTVSVLSNTNFVPSSFYLTINAHNTSMHDAFLQQVATGWILNDEYVPTISASPLDMDEGNDSHQQQQPVGLSGPASKTVSVNFATQDGTARNGVDYVSSTGQVVFVPPVTTQYFSFTILGDIVKQTNRTFFVNFSGPNNATLATTQVVDTIYDDDPLSLPNGFKVSLVTTNLYHPVAMDFAPDGRLFICEQAGTLRVIKNGALLPTPFVTVNTDTFDQAEAGLLGIAFDPDFGANQFVYVYYTALTPYLHNRISRFTASGDIAIPGSEFVVLDLDQVASSRYHNAGALHFGTDGKLYIGTGDNQNGTNSQSYSSLLGKILRVNSNGSIPSDNPFFLSASGSYRAIWALGLRNPFSFAIQPGTGRLLINDVGENTWEEIDEGQPGANYGWPNAEGVSGNPTYKNPIYFYGHTNSACAIVGGTFYNPSKSQFPPDYQGNYLFADYCAGTVRRLATNNIVLPFISGLALPVDLKIGPDGVLYCLTAFLQGKIYRIFYDTSSRFQFVRHLSDGRIQLHATGAISHTYTLQMSTNLSDWLPISTNTFATSEVDLFDSNASSQRRFYRLAE